MIAGIRKNHHKRVSRRHKRFDSRNMTNGNSGSHSFHHRHETSRNREGDSPVVFIVKDILYGVFKCVTNGEILVALFRKKDNASYYVNKHSNYHDMYIIKEIETDF